MPQTSVYMRNTPDAPAEETNSKKPRKRQRKNAATTNAITPTVNSSPKKKNAGQNTPPMIQQNFTPNFPQPPGTGVRSLNSLVNILLNNSSFLWHTTKMS